MKSIAIFALALCIVAISTGSSRAVGGPPPTINVIDADGHNLGVFKGFTPSGGVIYQIRSSSGEGGGIFVNLEVTGNVAAYSQPLFSGGNACNGPTWSTGTPLSLEDQSTVMRGPGDHIGVLSPVPGIPDFFANTVSYPQPLPGGGEAIICAPVPNSPYGPGTPFISNGFAVGFSPLTPNQLNDMHLPPIVPVHLVNDP
jgi:hypothetical protein